jgi:hypothetical protein
VTKDRVVSVGLLSERDLEVLGTGFTRISPLRTRICSLSCWQLDEVKAALLENGVTLVPHKQR